MTVVSADDRRRRSLIAPSGRSFLHSYDRLWTIVESV